MFHQRSFTIISLVVVLLLLAACGGAATPAPEQPAATEAPAEQPAATEEAAVPTEAPATEEAVVTEEAPAATEEAAAGGAHTVGFVPPALTSPFHVAMVDGATARSEELERRVGLDD
ncbi:MAG: hypothetical protein DPW09_36985 [Anaerolineae bacterium]|nr:hypothetical protein [Anaerolineae bacterium]